MKHTPPYRDEIFRREYIAPVPFLESLRLAVIGDGRTRLPRWRVEAPEVPALELRPRASARVLFECKANASPGVRAGDLKLPRDARRGTPEITFLLTAEAVGRWGFAVRSAYYAREDGGRADYASVLDLRRAVLATLTPEFGRGLEVSFSDRCLFCGRPLTDPISRARFFGPECANALGVPSVIRLAESLARGPASRSRVCGSRGVALSGAPGLPDLCHKCCDPAGAASDDLDETPARVSGKEVRA